MRRQDIMIEVVELSQQEYIEELIKQKNPQVRQQMKILAHSAMYGTKPDAKIYLPSWMLSGDK